jgi:hypothetical protein
MRIQIITDFNNEQYSCHVTKIYALSERLSLVWLRDLIFVIALSFNSLGLNHNFVRSFNCAGYYNYEKKMEK